MTWVDAPICERCWVEREGTWEEADGDVDLVRLVALRQPLRMINPINGEFRIENCHFCDWPTFCGIYQRVQT
jgi:hypothetical protein